MAVARRKPTVYLDEDVLRASRVLAPRTGQHAYEIVNAALRSVLGLAAVERVWARSEPSEGEVLELASSELRSTREESGSRGAFVDVAHRLIQTKAYEQISVQDVLDAVGASRGGLYHYFESKQDLLEAAVVRLVEVALASMTPILAVRVYPRSRSSRASSPASLPGRPNARSSCSASPGCG